MAFRSCQLVAVDLEFRVHTIGATLGILGRQVDFLNIHLVTSFGLIRARAINSNVIFIIVNKYSRNAKHFEVNMTKAERRANNRFKERYGHHGAGASHTREASEAEVIKHIQKARAVRKRD
jgi:hypothetical protein